MVHLSYNEFVGNFGKNLKILRNSSGLIGDDFAGVMEMSRANLYKLENTKTIRISFRALYNRVKNYDITLNDIFCGKLEPKLSCNYSDNDGEENVKINNTTNKQRYDSVG